MNETSRIEPAIEYRAAADGPHGRTVVDPNAGGAAARHNLEQLARIEEKTARIEDKFARSETLLLRVQATFEDAMAEFNGLARRADFAPMEQRLKRLPGLGSLILVGILVAVLSSALTLAAWKYGIPGVFPKQIATTASTNP